MTTTWNPLPSGKGITLVPGQQYKAMASVKDSHTTAQIKSLLAGAGLTIVDFQDPATGQAVASGYRLVSVTGTATKGGKIPWGIPWWFPGDSTTILQAWSSGAPILPVEDGAEWILAGIVATLGAATLWLIKRESRG